MREKSDAQLLREYAEGGNEAAFQEIVLRHTDMVYASALRQLGSPDLACDIAQGVFTDLAQKAQSLAESLDQGASVLGWLFRSTRFAALNQLREDRRRQARERLAMAHLDPTPETTPEWNGVRPVLDAAIADLSDEEREAVLLRFFKSRDFRTIGQALGVSDDAAQKRVSRALERLRVNFASRGISTTAATLSAVLSLNAVPVAPAGLAAAFSTAALAGKTIATPATFTTAQAIAMTTLHKSVIGLTLAALVGTGIYHARVTAGLREHNQALQQQQALAAGQVEQLTRERDAERRKSALLRDDNERLKRTTPELLRLRGEVGTLRREREQFQAAQNTAAPKEQQLESEQSAPWAIKDVDPPPPMKEFEMAYEASATNVPSATRPTHILVLRALPSSVSHRGKWAKIYGFADGSSNLKLQTDVGFEAWEQQLQPDPGFGPWKKLQTAVSAGDR